jgi:hypothetical protein
MYSVFFGDLSALLLYGITTALFLLWDIFNIVDYIFYAYGPPTKETPPLSPPQQQSTERTVLGADRFWNKEWYYAMDFAFTVVIAMVLVASVGLTFVLYRRISTDVHSQPVAYIGVPNRADAFYQTTPAQ